MRINLMENYNKNVEPSSTQESLKYLIISRLLMKNHVNTRTEKQIGRHYRSSQKSVSLIWLPYWRKPPNINFKTLSSWNCRYNELIAPKISCTFNEYSTRSCRYFDSERVRINFLTHSISLMVYQLLLNRAEFSDRLISRKVAFHSA